MNPNVSKKITTAVEYEYNRIEKSDALLDEIALERERLVPRSYASIVSTS